MEAQDKGVPPVDTAVRWRSKGRGSGSTSKVPRRGKVVGHPEPGKLEVEYRLTMGQSRHFGSAWGAGKTRRVVIGVEQLLLD